MKVLVTGMTSRQTKEDRTIAGHIADTLRASGHEVDVKRPSLKDVLDGTIDSEYDHAFVGLGPLHGIGTSYKYGALATIGQMWENLTLYLDDVDSGKIGSGLRIMQKHNWKLVKPFYGYCAEYEIASKPENHQWLLDVIDTMLSVHAEDHPPLLVPAFTLDDAFKTGGRISAGAQARSVPIDWSVMSTTLERDVTAARERYGPANEETPPGLWWSTETVPENRSVRSLGPYSWPVVHVSQKALEVMYASAGYISPGSAWTPRFYQVSTAGIPIVSPWRVFADYIGDAFEELSGAIEFMTPEQRADLAARQLAQLEAFVPSREQLNTIVDGVMRGTYAPTARQKD